MQLSLETSAGFAFLPLYFIVSLLIGWVASRQNRNASAYLNASRALPLWIVTAAYLAANCGALEIVGLSAMAAQYGVQAFHFYWIGAIPAMVFLALWMMPVYRQSGIRTVPEYLEVRYGPGVRLLNAGVVAIMLLLLAGISLYAMGQVLQVVLGLSFLACVLLSAAVVLAYVLLGGLRATIYNEVFQLLVMLAGLVPLAIHCVVVGRTLPAQPPARIHLWHDVPVFSHAAPLDSFGIVVGLGFVLSFGYWCTDFVLMQRAFTARTDAEARQVPLWAGFGKLAFSLIVVLPGLVAYRLVPELGSTRRFDQVLPLLMKILYGPAMLGLGLTALIASLMSSLAANVSAFATIFTQDIYRSQVQHSASERHYLTVARVASTAAVLFSILACYLNFFFSDLMEHVQLIFSVLASPFWAIFLLGMATRKTTAKGAIVGFLSGAAVALLHLAAFLRGWLHYGSMMNANFHSAVYAFTAAFFTGLIAGRPNKLSAQVPQRLVFDWKIAFHGSGVRVLWVLSVALLAVCVVLNVVWR